MANIYQRKPPQIRSSGERNSVKKTSPEKNEKQEKKASESKRMNEINAEQLRKQVYELIGKTKNPFTAFAARPKKIGFENQFDGEEIILLLRKHWFTNLRWVAGGLLMFFAPLVLIFFPLIDFLPGSFQFVVILMWYLLSFAFILESFLGWYFNVYIVTDERIVDIDFYNLAYKEISDAEIEKIEDVTMTVVGVVRTLLNFGRVTVQTAAEMPQFEFDDVPNPSLVVQILERLRVEEKIEELEGRLR